MIRHGNRRGVFLVELAILISVTALLFALAIVVFARILAMRRMGQDHLERTVQTARMAEQFRRDVWAAHAVSPANGQATKLTLELADEHRVEYAIVESALQRTEVVDSKPRPAQLFRIPNAEVLQFAIDEIGDKERLGILVAPLRSHPVEGESPYGKSIRISALLARDPQLAHSPEAPKND